VTREEHGRRASSYSFYSWQQGNWAYFTYNIKLTIENIEKAAIMIMDVYFSLGDVLYVRGTLK
jgi:hypothetical protein